MSAIKFIKEHGVDKAREVVDGQKDTVAPNLFKYFSPSLNDYHMLNIESNVRISELKRLVESVDLVKRYGGIAEVKTLHQDEFWSERVFERLKQAIADYEAIHSFDIEKREFELGLAPDSDYVKGGEHV